MNNFFYTFYGTRTGIWSIPLLHTNNAFSDTAFTPLQETLFEHPLNWDQNKSNTGISLLWVQLEKEQQEQWNNCARIRSSSYGDYFPAIQKKEKSLAESQFLFPTNPPSLVQQSRGDKKNIYPLIYRQKPWQLGWLFTEKTCEQMIGLENHQYQG